ILQPVFVYSSRQKTDNGAVKIDEIGCRRNVYGVTFGHATISVQDKRIRKVVPIDEVGDGFLFLLDTYRNDGETVLVVLTVGLPQRGCTGIASRSPGMHEGDHDRSTTKVTQTNLLPIDARKFKLGCRRSDLHDSIL